MIANSAASSLQSNDTNYSADLSDPSVDSVTICDVVFHRQHSAQQILRKAAASLLAEPNSSPRAPVLVYR